MLYIQQNLKLNAFVYTSTVKSSLPDLVQWCCCSKDSVYADTPPLVVGDKIYTDAMVPS